MLTSSSPPRQENVGFSVQLQLNQRYDKLNMCLFAWIVISLLQGVDFPDVDIVVKAGLPESTAYSLQCGGRVLRWGQRTGIYVIFYEPWVEDIDLDEYEGTFPDDPDRPCTTLTVKSSKRDHAPLSAVTLIKGRMCKRQFHAHYLSDTDPRCTCIL